MINTILQQPLVSVIVISYNHEKYIERCLDGLFSQTYSNLEIFIRDDASTDSTQSIINKYLQERPGFSSVHTDLDQNNKGLLWSLNSSISKVNGEYVCLCAGDDYFHPDRIKLQLEIINSISTEFGIVYGDMNVVDENNTVIHDSFNKWHLKDAIPPSGDVIGAFIYSNPIHLMSMLVKKDVYDSVGKFDENLIFEDWDMAMRMSRITKFYSHPDIVASYRKHSGQMTDVYWANEEKYKKILETIFKLLSKHLDLEVYRKRILKNLFKIFLKQISLNVLIRSEKIRRSSFLLKNRFSVENVAVHILIYLYIDKITIGILRKVISLK
jgi:glycosyltransferase involved in cell wall biosynthesis